MIPRPRPIPITVRPRPRKWSRDHAGLEILTSLLGSNKLMPIWLQLRHLCHAVSWTTKKSPLVDSDSCFRMSGPSNTASDMISRNRSVKNSRVGPPWSTASSLIPALSTKRISNLCSGWNFLRTTAREKQARMSVRTALIKLPGGDVLQSTVSCSLLRSSCQSLNDKTLTV